MDCGVPFCQGDTGCPVQNLIPEWNDLVHQGRWWDALTALHATNNFPELTGRLCPAPCETACVLGITAQPVAIRSIEQAIADRGFAEGWITPVRAARETGHRVAVVGSGPAGLTAAQQLCRLGHTVVVYEQADRVGGLLRYGIPDFKLDKSVLDRRLAQMVAEGVVFERGVRVGGADADLSGDDLQQEYDAICLAIGASRPRELTVPGRQLRGVHLAMDYLAQQNRRVAGDAIPGGTSISAHGKRVVIIGGGDTGSDCLGTCHRQGAAEVLQFELLGAPPLTRASSTPWPTWPMQLRTSHAHEEGGRREWQISTTGFAGRGAHVTHLRAVRVDTRVGEPGITGERRVEVTSVGGTECEFEADLVLLAMGFVGPEPAGLLAELGLELNARGLVGIDAHHQTNTPGVFAAGDASRGASLIVWAIREGRDAATGIDRYLDRRAAERRAAERPLAARK